MMMNLENYANVVSSPWKSEMKVVTWGKNYSNKEKDYIFKERPLQSLPVISESI